MVVPILTSYRLPDNRNITRCGSHCGRRKRRGTIGAGRIRHQPLGARRPTTEAAARGCRLPCCACCPQPQQQCSDGCRGPPNGVREGHRVRPRYGPYMFKTIAWVLKACRDVIHSPFKQTSVQVPALIKSALKRGYVGHVGKGANLWNHGELVLKHACRTHRKLTKAGQLTSKISAMRTCSYLTAFSKEIPIRRKATRGRFISFLRCALISISTCEGYGASLDQILEEQTGEHEWAIVSQNIGAILQSRSAISDPNPRPFSDDILEEDFWGRKQTLKLLGSNARMRSGESFNGYWAIHRVRWSADCCSLYCTGRLQMLGWRPRAGLEAPTGRPKLLDSIEEDVNAILGEVKPTSSSACRIL